MSDSNHEKAIDLTEKALDAAEAGDEATAKRLADQAKKLDPAAVKEVVDELEQAKDSPLLDGTE